MDIKMNDLPLSPWAVKALREELQTPVHEFVDKYTRADLLKKRKLGVRTLKHIVETIREHTGKKMAFGEIDTDSYGLEYIRLLRKSVGQNEKP